MLYSDADFVSLADLAAIDGEISKIAGMASLGLTLEGPGSVIRRAIEECGSVLTAKFQSYTGYAAGAGSAAHQYAVNFTGWNNALTRPRFHLCQVVAIEPDPAKVHLKRWVEYCCLSAAYRAISRRYSGKDMDRYRAKFEEYASDAKAASSLLWSVGVPIITFGGPLDCPGALRQFGAGTFDATAVTHGGSGSTDPGTLWRVAITYVGSPYVSPTVKGNAESAGSVIQTVQTVPNETITVSIAGLTPPTGDMPNIGNSDGLYTPMAATGWLIYAGSVSSGMYLQNASPIPIGTLSFTLPNAPVLSGSLLQSGQFSSRNEAFMNVVMRA